MLPDFDVALELELTKQCDPGEAIQSFDMGLLEDPPSSGELGLPLIILGRGLIGVTEGNSAICLIAAEVGSSQPLCYGSQQLQVKAATTDLSPE